MGGLGKKRVLLFIKQTLHEHLDIMCSPFRLLEFREGHRFLSSPLLSFPRLLPSPSPPQQIRSGAAIGVGMSRGFLVSWFLVSWFLICLGLLVSCSLGFEVYWFSWLLGFLVSWFMGVLISWFLGFNVSMIPCYRTVKSCYLENIDPVAKIFKILLKGWGVLPSPIFRKSSTLWIPNILRHIKTVCF